MKVHNKRMRKLHGLRVLLKGKPAIPLKACKEVLANL